MEDDDDGRKWEKLENNLLDYNLGRLDIGNVLVFINTSGTGS